MIQASSSWFTNKLSNVMHPFTFNRQYFFFIKDKQRHFCSDSYSSLCSHTILNCSYENIKAKTVNECVCLNFDHITLTVKMQAGTRLVIYQILYTCYYSPLFIWDIACLWNSYLKVQYIFVIILLISQKALKYKNVEAKLKVNFLKSTTWPTIYVSVRHLKKQYKYNINHMYV